MPGELVWVGRCQPTWTNVRLEALLFPPPSDVPADLRPMPDWAVVHREMRRPNVTLALLWEEYRAGTADGFGY